MKPKILIFIDWYKPGFKAGGPIQSISNLINRLNNSAEFYVITRDTDYLETKPYHSVNSNSWNDIGETKVFYLPKSEIKYSKLKTLIKEVEPQIIYCNSLFSLYFSILPIFISKKLGITHILAVRGMLSAGSLSVKNRKKVYFLALMNFVKFYKKTTIHATTQPPPIT